jgi:diacylglycerol kinase family enzyme
VQLAVDKLSPRTDRVLILVNPKAGARSVLAKIGRLTDLLQGHGLHTQVSTDLAEAADCANRWHAEDRLRALVGVGGDGTAAELANRTAAGVPITLFPAGNENLLARHLGLAASPEACCRTIVEANVVRLDAARAGQRIFLLMAGCGFDADVVHRFHAGRRGHVSRSSYVKPILDSIRTYQYPEVEVCWNTAPAGGRPQWSAALAVRWVFAFNVPRYAGGLMFTPQADASDGLLDVCTFRPGGLWHGMRFAAAVLLRQNHRLADCTMCRASGLRITSAAEVPYQLDGDPGGFLPVEIEVLPGRMTLLVRGKKQYA